VVGWWVGGCCHAVTDYLLLLVCSSVRVFCPGTNGFESRIKKTHKQKNSKISAKKFSSQKSCEADQQQQKGKKTINDSHNFNMIMN
jgi:hypothetical protein